MDVDEILDKADVHVVARFVTEDSRPLDGYVLFRLWMRALTLSPAAFNHRLHSTTGCIQHSRELLFVANQEAVCLKDTRAERLQKLNKCEANCLPLEFRLLCPVEGHPDYTGAFAIDLVSMTVSGDCRCW